MSLYETKNKTSIFKDLFSIVTDQVSVQMQMQITELQNNYILKVVLTEENIRQFYGSLPKKITRANTIS